MPLIVHKDEFLRRKQELLPLLRTSVVVYPTDTIYGLGCDASQEQLVDRIRALKRRAQAPFSVIAPSKDWIEQRCDVPEAGEEWLDRLPGPYTLVLPRNDDRLAPSVAPGATAIGVRIPDHWFSGVVADLDIPFVTTSVNRTGEPHLISLEQLDSAIRDAVDLIIDEGPLESRPSTVVRLDRDQIEVVRR